MAVSFFGQFLLKQGAVDAAAIDAAMAYRNACNRRFGELAVERGLLTDEQAQRVFATQKRDMRPFGEVALSLRFLKRKQLDELLFSQTILCTHLGEALLRKGYLDEERFSVLLAAYDAEQQERRQALAALLAGAARPGEAVGLVDALRRALFRYLGEEVKIVAPDRDVAVQEYAVCIALAPMAGESGPRLELYLPQGMLDLVARSCALHDAEPEGKNAGDAMTGPAGGHAMPSCWGDFMAMLGRYMRLAVSDAGSPAWLPVQGRPQRVGDTLALVVDTMAGPWGVLFLPRGA
ncbi:MAG: hypothetical protein AB7E47_06250 [Desulfovibrionaceae bacterium]